MSHILTQSVAPLPSQIGGVLIIGIGECRMTLQMLCLHTGAVSPQSHLPFHLLKLPQARVGLCPTPSPLAPLFLPPHSRGLWTSRARIAQGLMPEPDAYSTAICPGSGLGGRERRYFPRLRAGLTAATRQRPPPIDRSPVSSCPHHEQGPRTPLVVHCLTRVIEDSNWIRTVALS